MSLGNEVYAIIRPKSSAEWFGGKQEGSMICNTILEAMGHTPLVRLNRMVTADMAEILVKFEAINVGGSIKTRTAYNMICQAEKDGILKPDSIIVEPTSGNQGIGLALVGAVKGYKTVIIMPDSEFLWIRTRFLSVTVPRAIWATFWIYLMWTIPC